MFWAAYAWKELNMQFFEYKGYTIYPVPRLLGVTGSWMINLIIKNGNATKNFSKQAYFPTQGEAVFHSMHYGKQLIDRVLGCTAKPEREQS